MRSPILPDKQLLIGTTFVTLESGKAFEYDNCLDPLSEDKHKNSWSVQSDESKT
jgi:hypothetical protein